MFLPFLFLEYIEEGCIIFHTISAKRLNNAFWLNISDKLL